jgi:sulfur carrier protein
MKLIVNGKPKTVASGATLQSLLIELGLKDAKGTAVEFNDEFVEADEYGKKLKNGDKIEIVRFVGGG